jgi:glycosyltransferase involved in cell wall biosynthesis
MFLLSFTSKPVVYEVHDFPTLQQIFKRILVSVAIRVQEVRFRLGCQSLIYVFISEALRNAYSRVFPLHKQVYLTVPSTVTPLLPLRRKEVRHRKSKFQDRLKIVYAGALRPEKGIDLVIHLASQLPDLEFTLLGDPAELESSYRRRLAGLRNITLLGYVNHDHIHPLISDADIALLPNACPPTQTERDILQINRWTSPLKVFDYLAAGVAICYSDIPVLNEILTDGVTGVACKCNDFNDWKVKVSNLRYEDDQRKQLGYSARQLFEEKYVLNKRCEKLITVHKLTTVQRAVNEE